MITRKLKELQMKFELLWFRRRQILFTTIAGALVGFLVAVFAIAPQYTAENELYFSAYTANKNKTVSDSQLENSRGLAESYAVYMEESFMLDRAEKYQPKNLSHHYTANEIKNAIRIRVDSDANVIFFRVTTENAQDSALLCDFYSEFSMREIVELTGVGTYEIFNETKVPSFPSFPNPVLFALFGAALGFFLAAYLALKLKQKIYLERDLKLLIPDCKVFTCIPYIKP